MPLPQLAPLTIVLVGLPGSGKSTVGRQLARRLGVPFIDSDHVIEERHAVHLPLQAAEKYEARFRDIEQETLDELSQGPAAVLSTGGGACMREATRNFLKARGQVIYLRSTPEDIYRRIKHDRGRPLLLVADPLQRLRDLYAQRDPLYREVAHSVVDAGHGTAHAVVNLMTMQLDQLQWAATPAAGAATVEAATAPSSDTP